MPTTAVGLVIFLSFLAPGFCFSIRRELTAPSRRVSVFRETVTLAVVSLFCNTVILMLFGVLRVIIPQHTPNIGGLVRDTRQYLVSNYSYILWWTGLLLLLSCTLAVLLARFEPDITKKFTRPITPTSSWWELFHLDPDARIYVGCELDDGSYLGGPLLTFSTEVDETADRELALSAPILYRAPGQDSAILEDVSAVSISARRLKFMAVSYLPAGTNLQPEAG